MKAKTIWWMNLNFSVVNFMEATLLTYPCSKQIDRLGKKMKFQQLN
jgi:hypothetical protein